MLMKSLISAGLAHRCYLLGDAGEAAVVDPPRDVDRVIDAATDAGLCITRVFETHRHEDFVSGAAELARRTGADVWRGRNPDASISYARCVSDGQCFDFGALRLTAIETPGHTDDSISLAFAHRASGDAPVGVFTGDALFVGATGRTDFRGEHADEDAARLHDSLHRRLLTLGDGVTIHPAHGAGSVCGSDLVDREWSTIGHERANNALLRLDRDAFVAAKRRERHVLPPWFARMRASNSNAGAPLDRLPAPAAMGLDALDDAVRAGAQLLDLRGDTAIAGGRMREAIAIPLELLPTFGGWFVDDARPVVMVLDAPADRDEALRALVRQRCDRVVGFLAKGFDAWSAAGRPVASIPGIDVHALRERLASDDAPLLLDVRAPDEFDAGHVDGAVNRYVGEIDAHAPALARDRSVVTICDTGRRALVAAAALQRLGRDDVAVCWGSMKAWRAAGYPVREG